MSTTDTAWMDDAACAQTAHVGLPWLADADQVTNKHTSKRAAIMAGVCAGCPVQTLCAAYAANTGVTGGFWSGADRLPSGWATDTANDVDDSLSWVPRSSRHGQLWEQGALALGGLEGAA